MLRKLGLLEQTSLDYIEHQTGKQGGRTNYTVASTSHVNRVCRRFYTASLLSMLVDDELLPVRHNGCTMDVQWRRTHLVL